MDAARSVPRHCQLKGTIMFQPHIKAAKIHPFHEDFSIFNYSIQNWN